MHGTTVKIEKKVMPLFIHSVAWLEFLCRFALLTDGRRLTCKVHGRVSNKAASLNLVPCLKSCEYA